MMPISAPHPATWTSGRSTRAEESEMIEDRDDAVLVARVRLSLADGTVEEWMVPMQLTDDALSYHAAVFPPEGAVVLSVDPLKREGAIRQDLVIARADIATL